MQIVECGSKRLLLLLLAFAAIARAEVTTYRSESAYLSGLSSFGYISFTEGFEDEIVWEGTRTPAAADSVVSQGVVWTSNHPYAISRAGRLSTSYGAARSGQWGVYSEPHGDPDVTDPNGFMYDGILGTRVAGTSTVHGVGGWFWGLPGSKIRIILDGNDLNSYELGIVDQTPQFFGVISTAGFHRFEIREMEGTRMDQKYIFADDFTIAVVPGECCSVNATSGASYAGPPLAADSIATVWGKDMATSIGYALSFNLPTLLEGTEVWIRDSIGAQRRVPLFYVSPDQINFLVPSDTQNGPATVTVTSWGQTVASGPIQVETVAPGLFAANANGRGVAAALVDIRHADGSSSIQAVFDCGSIDGSCVNAPINLGAETDQVFLSLFGTGIRYRTALSAVQVEIGGVSVDVLYADSQGYFVGLDQVNVSLPRSLVGRGDVDIVLTVDGVRSNKVTMSIQ
ncbi:MAG: hypothetical protein ABFD89_11990 [Bryobacteraceae bacterium]